MTLAFGKNLLHLVKVFFEQKVVDSEGGGPINLKKIK